MSAGPALRELHEEFGDRVRFVTLYVREAHPGDRYPQPHTFEKKLQQARDYVERDGIPWTVAVDDIDGTLHRQLDEKPDSAYFVSPDGHVLFRTTWSNHRKSMREGLEAAAAGVQPDDAEREPMVVPMLRGVGTMHRALSLSGDVAKKDVLKEVPPMYAMARTADLFRPLPPLARGGLAAGLLGLGAIALVTLGLYKAVEGSNG